MTIERITFLRIMIMPLMQFWKYETIIYSALKIMLKLTEPERMSLRMSNLVIQKMRPSNGNEPYIV